METVPSFVRDLVLDAAEHERTRSCGVRVGRRVEVDVCAVENVDRELAARLRGYWAACTQFWTRDGNVEQTGGAVLTRRVLTAAVQSDAPGGRRELDDEVRELTALPGVGELIDEILGAEPDVESVSRRGFRLGLTLKKDSKKNMLRVAVRLPGRAVWSETLGGAHSPGEFHRVLELRVSHAKWRDRRSRRLVALTVWAEEIWPDPQR